MKDIIIGVGLGVKTGILIALLIITITLLIDRLKKIKRIFSRSRGCLYFCRK